MIASMQTRTVISPLRDLRTRCAVFVNVPRRSHALAPCVLPTPRDTACERTGAFMSTETRLRKPQRGEIDVGIRIPAIKLRIEIGRTDGWSRIQE